MPEAPLRKSGDTQMPDAANSPRRHLDSRPHARLLRGLRRRWDVQIALVWIFLIVTVSLAAPLLPIPDPMRQSLSQRLKPPFWMAGASPGHLLGTDQLGRDILSRTITGAQISLLVGVSSVVLAGTLGVLAGLFSGYSRGRIADAVSRVADVQIAFPFIVFGIAVVAVVGTGILNLVLVLGIYGWVVYARVVRSETLSVREREFIEAARAAGAGSLRIVFQHILPNVSSSILVLATVSVAQMIISESSLSFLGLGVPPTVPSWGSMLADGRQNLEGAWWIAVIPGLALVITVLELNVIADLARDALDPRLQA